MQGRSSGSFQKLDFKDVKHANTPVGLRKAKTQLVAGVYPAIEHDSTVMSHGATYGVKTEVTWSFVVGDDLIMSASNRLTDRIHELILRASDENVSLDYQSPNGETAFMIACERGYHEIVECFITQKVSLDVQNHQGLTPLMAASYRNHKDIVELLIEKKAKLDLVNDDGDSALIIACRHGHKDIMRALVEAGADVGIMNKAGKSAIDYAVNVKSAYVFDLYAHMRDIALLKQRWIKQRGDVDPILDPKSSAAQKILAFEKLEQSVLITLEQSAHHYVPVHKLCMDVEGILKKAYTSGGQFFKVPKPTFGGKDKAQKIVEQQRDLLFQKATLSVDDKSCQRSVMVSPESIEDSILDKFYDEVSKAQAHSHADQKSGDHKHAQLSHKKQISELMALYSLAHDIASLKNEWIHTRKAKPDEDQQGKPKKTHPKVIAFAHLENKIKSIIGQYPGITCKKVFEQTALILVNVYNKGGLFSGVERHYFFKDKAETLIFNLSTKLNTPGYVQALLAECAWVANSVTLNEGNPQANLLLKTAQATVRAGKSHSSSL